MKVQIHADTLTASLSPSHSGRPRRPTPQPAPATARGRGITRITEGGEQQGRARMRPSSCSMLKMVMACLPFLWTIAHQPRDMHALRRQHTNNVHSSKERRTSTQSIASLSSGLHLGHPSNAHSLRPLLLLRAKQMRSILTRMTHL